MVEVNSCEKKIGGIGEIEEVIEGKWTTFRAMVFQFPDACRRNIARQKDIDLG